MGKGGQECEHTARTECYSGARGRSLGLLLSENSKSPSKSLSRISNVRNSVPQNSMKQPLRPKRRQSKTQCKTRQSTKKEPTNTQYTRRQRGRDSSRRSPAQSYLLIVGISHTCKSRCQTPNHQNTVPRYIGPRKTTDGLPLPEPPTYRLTQTNDRCGHYLTERIDVGSNLD